MPYYIKQGAIGCDGWATVKDDGEVVGCHQSKADAIAQMVAISLAEGIEPGGERALASEVAEGVFVEWYDEEATYKGQIEYVMTDGVFGVEGGEYSLEASADDPVLLVRRWKFEVDEGYWEPEEALFTKRANEVVVIKPLIFEAVLPPLVEEDERSWRVKELEQIRKGGSTEVETRRLTVQDFEIREGEQGSMSFRGYAAVFNSDSEPLPFTERILPGAFDKTLRSRNNIKMYLNHDSTLVLGSTRSKTLRLSVDGKGLLVDADLPDTSYARDLSVLMERGDVDSMSFGFSVPSGGDRWSPDGMTRELKQIRLHEVSVVTGFPAYQATTAGLRSLASDVDAETLSQALTTLENGEPLSGRHADLLESIINQLRDGDTQDEQNLIALKRKQIELLLNKF